MWSSACVSIPARSAMSSGSAAACGRREGSELTFYGTIKLSPYDLDRDPPTYTWYGTGLHEAGHVRGIGGIPRWHELLREPSSNSNPGAADTHFPGLQAVRAFKRGGRHQLIAGGPRVPGGQRTVRSSPDLQASRYIPPQGGLQIRGASGVTPSCAPAWTARPSTSGLHPSAREI